jgi:hypothetical protein
MEAKVGPVASKERGEVEDLLRIEAVTGLTRLGKRSPDAEAPMELIKQPERGVVAHDGRWLEAGTLLCMFPRPASITPATAVSF